MRILLLVDALDGFAQRAWCEVRAAGHGAAVEPFEGADLAGRVAAVAPELIVAPFTEGVVPAVVRREFRTVELVESDGVGSGAEIGPGVLERALVEGRRDLAVLALRFLDDRAETFVCGRERFVVQEGSTKTSLCAGARADAALAVIHRVIARAASEGLDAAPGFVPGRYLPIPDRSLELTRVDTETAVRSVRAADGPHGVRCRILGVGVRAFDAHPEGGLLRGHPGEVIGRRLGAILVRTRDGGVWLGSLRRAGGIVLPTTVALGGVLAGVPELAHGSRRCRTGTSRPAGAHRDLTYTRSGDVGTLRMDLPGGAMSTVFCQRLLAALRHALGQSTRVLVLRGSDDVFATGIDLCSIEVADDPVAESWRNACAIDDVCREIVTSSEQIVVAAVSGDASAGGAMLPLGADRVLLREGVVLNPHHRRVGYSGSEYWTYTLPRRVGVARALELTGRCLPVGAHEAVSIGLADAMLPRDPAAFDAAVAAVADGLCGAPWFDLLAGKRARLDRELGAESPHLHRSRELAVLREEFASSTYAQLRQVATAGAPAAALPLDPDAARTLPAPVDGSITRRIAAA